MPPILTHPWICQKVEVVLSRCYSACRAGVLRVDGVEEGDAPK